MRMGSRADSFQARSMGLCLGSRHPVLSGRENSKRLGLKRPFALPRPRTPGLGPRSHFSCLLMDALVNGVSQAGEHPFWVANGVRTRFANSIDFDGGFRILTWLPHLAKKNLTTSQRRG